MNQQLREGGKRKKQANRSAETGFEAWTLWRKAVEDRDIDPANLFDPEEFSVSRREVKTSRP
jgi:hypothetical protein